MQISGVKQDAAQTGTIKNGKIQGTGMAQKSKEDSELKSIQQQMDDVRKQMQDLGKDTGVTSDEKKQKMEKLKKQLTTLQSQYQQRQAEIQKEQAEEKAKKMQEEMEKRAEQQKQIQDQKNGRRNSDGDTVELSRMASIIQQKDAVDSAVELKQVRTKKQSRLNVVNQEIETDSGKRMGPTDGKIAEAAALQSAVSDMDQTIGRALGKANHNLNKISKEVTEAKAETRKDDKAVKEDEDDKSVKEKEEEKIKKQKKEEELKGQQIDLYL